LTQRESHFCIFTGRKKRTESDRSSLVVSDVQTLPPPKKEVSFVDYHPPNNYPENLYATKYMDYNESESSSDNSDLRNYYIPQVPTKNNLSS
jgi:hypothetical protein